MSDLHTLKVVQTFPADAVTCQLIREAERIVVLAMADCLKVNSEVVMKSKSKVFDVDFDDRMMYMVEGPQPKSVVLSQIPIHMLVDKISSP